MTDPEEFRRRLNDNEARMGELYRERRKIMEEFSEAMGEPVLPPPRARSEHQQRVARCPRCGGRLENSVAAE